jgi:hypothetical protein
MRVSLRKLEGVPKQMGRSSCPRGWTFPGDDPVKRRHACPDRGQIDLQEPEGLGVDDVEAAAPVHEDLGEPNVADDGVDNEQIFPRARHAVGVVPWSKVMGLSDQSR